MSLPEPGVAAVKVKMFGEVRSPVFPGLRTTEVAWEQGATVAHLRTILGIPPAASVVVVNGRRADEDTPLPPGAEVAFFPPLGGGSRGV